jgi:hypothetical protein
MYLAEVELGEVACRTRSRTRAAAYAGLQLGHLTNNLVALAQVIAVEVYCSWFVYRESEVNHLSVL